MSDQILQCIFIGVVLMAIALGITAAIGLIPRWSIPVAIVRGLATDVFLLYYWGRVYMRQH
jgi:hypothetical protein